MGHKLPVFFHVFIKMPTNESFPAILSLIFHLFAFLCMLTHSDGAT